MKDNNRQDDIQKLREDNRLLNEQIKQLVRAEKHLFNLRNENTKHLRRIEQLNDFLLNVKKSDGLEKNFFQAQALIHKLFILESSFSVFMTKEGLFKSYPQYYKNSREVVQANRAVNIDFQVESEWMKPLILEAKNLEEDDVASKLWQQMALFYSQVGEKNINDEVTDPVIFWIPVVAQEGKVVGAIVAYVSANKKIPITESIPGQEELSFLRVVKSNLDAVFEGTVMYEDLLENTENLEVMVQKRTHQLAETNKILRQQYSELQEAQSLLLASGKMAALGEMASGIAHEINTPLAVITTVASQMEEMIKKDQLKSDFGLKCADRIKATGFKIAKIITSLKTFSRDETNLPLVSASVKKMIEDVVVLCSEKLKRRNIKMNVSEISKSLKIECRPTQIEQVLLNLISNSTDAISNLDEKWIYVEVNVEDDFLVLSVTDSGSGIIEADLNRLFDPFYTTKDIGKGTGLGLSISKGIVESHEGKLFLDSKSENTKFVVKIPLSQSSESIGA